MKTPRAGLLSIFGDSVAPCVAGRSLSLPAANANMNTNTVKKTMTLRNAFIACGLDSVLVCDAVFCIWLELYLVGILRCVQVGLVGALLI